MTIAATRDALLAVLDDIDDVQVYRHRQENYHFPAVVIGWPQSMDVRPTMGSPRDFVIDVHVAVDVIDPESSDDRLSTTIDAVVEALLAEPNWDVQPVTDFGEQLSGDQRTVIWCRLPVAVFTG
jgi:hypothetical protein